MAKLKDLVDVNIGRDDIVIQGQKIPIVFTMQAFPYVEEAYGKSFIEFSNDLNAMLLSSDNNGVVSPEQLKIVSTLMYAMVRAAGTECTPLELQTAIQPNELPAAIGKTLDVFIKQYFQKNDIAKINDVNTSKKKKKKHRRR